jgi:hypothetical protein
MTGPLIRTPEHQYRLGDGPFVPGATGTARQLSKGPGLEYWFKSTAVQGVLNHLDLVPTLIEQGGIAAATAYFAKLPDFERDKAAARGSEIHDLADQIAKGAKPTVPAELVPHVQGELRYLRAHRPTKRRTEVMVYAHRGYGATIDELCHLMPCGDPRCGCAVLPPKGAVVIVERKSGRVYEDVRLQLAAQRHADLIGRADTERTWPMPKVAHTFVLHLRPEEYAKGYRLILMDTTETDYAAFLACLQLYEWRASLNGKG